MKFFNDQSQPDIDLQSLELAVRSYGSQTLLQEKDSSVNSNYCLPLVVAQLLSHSRLEGLSNDHTITLPLKATLQKSIQPQHQSAA